MYPLTMLRTSNRTPRLINAYACTSSIALPISLFAFLLNSFLLTGKFSNNFSTLTVVPLDRETRLEPTRKSPAGVKESAVPSGREGEVQVVMERVATPQREERASPRKPSVETVARSSNEVNLDVWCLSAVAARGQLLPLGEVPCRSCSPNPGQSSFSIPRPLSSTSISSRPCSRNLTATKTGTWVMPGSVRTRTHTREGTHKRPWHPHRGHSRPVP